MVDLSLPPSDNELRYRNVSIHSQGKTEYGTLYLLKHHACFSYYPGSNRSHHGSAAHSRNASGTHTTGANDPTPSNEGSANGSRDASALPTQPQAAFVGGAKASPDPKQQKVRPKDVWIPYPMIGSCILRASHAASMVARPTANERSEAPLENGDELFPPTFGTSGLERPSNDSARLAPYSTPPRPSSPVAGQEAPAYESARQPVIRIRRKDFQMMALHFNSGGSGLSADEAARQAFHVLRKRCCIEHIESLHAFHYQPHKDESRASVFYDARKEYARMGVSPKAADGAGTAWRISEINQNYSYSRTYPNVLCVPKAVSDNMLKYGASFRSRSRIPCLTYLHSNGGSITRSSQPQVGMGNNRSPQDERLVSAIFSSHTPATEPLEDPTPQPSTLASASSTTLDTPLEGAVNGNDDSPTLHSTRSEPALDEKANEQQPVPRVYGSTRRNLIVDARPLVNIQFNRVQGGGMENVANYMGSDHRPVEKECLNIANIHVMRKSLEKVFDSFGSADYVDMKPNQEALRKSGWLGHIAGLLDGSETVARVVGLGGSHALIHCSDGWDRTSQVAALAQIMLDPYYRTLNGFITLVQKDFMSFGHKFRDRDGIEGYDSWFKIENERIAPSRTRETNQSDPTSLNAMGQRAFKGAQQWFQRNRGNLFNQQRSGANSPIDSPSSRSSSPPPNSLIHSTPTPNSTADDTEHKMSANEISPVFHQFLDTVYQLLHQNPTAFEFNERFLKRLFYHTYACQYGEFLFNNEKDRAQHPKLPSVWGHFLSRRLEFTNPDFAPKVDDPLLFPKRRGIEREVEVRWWAGLFGRKDEDMNLPKALAPADPAPHTAPAPLRTSISLDEKTDTKEEGGKDGAATPAEDGNAIKEAKNTPSLAAMRDSLTNSFSSMGFRNSNVEGRTEATAQAHQQPPPAEQDPAQSSSSRQAGPPATAFDQMSIGDEATGDPLGASSSPPKQVSGGRSEGGGLDFAAFASQNAYRER